MVRSSITIAVRTFDPDSAELMYLYFESIQPELVDKWTSTMSGKETPSGLPPGFASIWGVTFRPI